MSYDPRHHVTVRHVSGSSSSSYKTCSLTPAPASVNIHSHSLGALFFLILIPLHLTQTHFPTWSLFHWFPRTTYTHDPTPIPPTLHDKVALTVYLVSAVGCLGLSSWFHTVQCHSRAVCDAAHRGDYVSISARRVKLVQLLSAIGRGG